MSKASWAGSWTRDTSRVGRGLVACAQSPYYDYPCQDSLALKFPYYTDVRCPPLGHEFPIVEIPYGRENSTP